MPQQLYSQMWFQILWPVVAATALNGLLFSMGWANAMPSNPFLPPGWTVGLVWTVLFILIGMARSILFNVVGDTMTARRWLLALIIYCLAYPFYSFVIDSKIGGNIGNVGCIILSIIAIRAVWRKSHKAAWIASPIIPWACYATIATLAGGN